MTKKNKKVLSRSSSSGRFASSQVARKASEKLAVSGIYRTESLQTHASQALRQNKRGAEEGIIEALLRRMDDMEDAMTVLQAQSRGVEKNALPSEFVMRIIAGETPLRVWREYREMTLDELSTTADISPAYANEVELGKKPGSVAFYKKVAAALKVSLDDLTD